MMTLFTTIRLGLNDSSATFKMKTIIEKAACNQVAYAYGFKNSFATSYLPAWEKKNNSSIEGNKFLNAILNPLSSDHSGSQKDVDYIEHIHSNYTRKLFCDAQNIKGGKASYEELIVTMNEKSSIPSETRCTLSLHRFIDNSGKEMSPKEKALDILDHKAKRKMWVKDWYTLLTDKFANVAMLDETWFYTTNRRRKIKRLPLGGNEKEGDDKESILK